MQYGIEKGTSIGYILEAKKQRLNRTQEHQARIPTGGEPKAGALEQRYFTEKSGEYLSQPKRAG
jgi:hypothetical protein